MLAFLFLVCQLANANTWIRLGDCVGWNYQNVDDWGTVSCPDVPNLCDAGKYQSPVKISSQRTVIDGSLEALAFTGYAEGPLTLSYDGVSLWADYNDQGSFNNPGIGDGEVFSTRQLMFATHNEQLLFTGINRFSLDILHYQTRKTWDTFPIGTDAVSIVSMYFKIGNTSRFLAPVFEALKKYKPGKNIRTNVSKLEITWPGLAEAFSTLQTEESHGYYNFQGSLTMPPCQETVEWFVFDFEWELDQTQFDTLHALIGGNNRPVKRQISKVDFFDPLIGKPEPFSFSKLSNGSIAALILGIILAVVALLTIFFGITSKGSAEHYGSY